MLFGVYSNIAGAGKNSLKKKNEKVAGNFSSYWKLQSNLQ
jgi:CRISPR/Cas system CMR-associated protein Cmr5 small subunit